MTIRKWIAGLLVFVFAGLANGEGAEPAQGESETKVDREEVAQEAQAPGAVRAEKTRERFAPSEEVPVGDAVSFPVDI